MDEKTCLFAHGFEGVPGGRKARYLRDTLGIEVAAPHMTTLGWTFEDQVAVLLDAIDRQPDLRLLVGSSMGGFATAVAASRRPDRDLRVVLMAPAVGIHAVWAEQLGDDGMKLWEEMGRIQYHHKGVGKEVMLPYRLWTQSLANAGVALEHPTVVVHGLDDEVIPIERSLAFAKASPGLRRFYAVRDGHRLLESLDVMADGIELVLA